MRPRHGLHHTREVFVQELPSLLDIELPEFLPHLLRQVNGHSMPPSELPHVPLFRRQVHLLAKHRRQRRHPLQRADLARGGVLQHRRQERRRLVGTDLDYWLRGLRLGAIDDEWCEEPDAAIFAPSFLEDEAPKTSSATAFNRQVMPHPLGSTLRPGRHTATPGDDPWAVGHRGGGNSCCGCRGGATALTAERPRRSGPGATGRAGGGDLHALLVLGAATKE
mmetsp:Transcript_127680/g.367462  ORF Transcript_127680/g.367462 Transcript_127680/m.367462 type:complete len:222 (-) Transcript_127680:1444-2109(-)